jgi:hypothetical protein
MGVGSFLLVELSPGPIMVRALLDAMTTDSWRAVCTLFMRFVRRSKRRQAQAALDRTRQRVLRAPGQRAAEVEALASELRPLIDGELCTTPQCEQFIQSVASLLEKAKPVVTAATLVQGDMFIFREPSSEAIGTQPSRAVPVSHGPGQPAGAAQAEYAGMLLQAIAALKDTAAAVKQGGESQSALASEVAAFSRIARESQKEAHTAQVTVLNLLAMMASLQRRLDDVTRERDELLDQLESATRQELDVAELKRQLHDTQRQVVRSNELYRRSQQELAQARQQQEAAERLADEATDRLARYEGAPPSTADYSGPDLDDYEQALDDLVAGRQAHEDRLYDIEQSLRQLSRPPAPASVPPPPPSDSGTSAAENERAGGTAVLAAPISGSSGLISSLIIIGLILTAIVFGITTTIRNYSYNLGDLRTTGSTPARTSYPPACSQAGCTNLGIEDLAYSLHPGRSVHTIFLVADQKTRYLSTNLSLSSSGRSCGGAARVSYTVYNNGHAISQGRLTVTADRQISDLPVGKHARLGFTAASHAPPGCVMSLSLANPTLNVVKAGLHL